MDAPPISLPILQFFRYIVRRYFRRHFHGVHLSGAARCVHDGRPFIVYANHSSWWDPMVLVLLAEYLMPEQSHYAPIDAEALARYGILRKVGLFPVELNTAKGAAQFLRTGLAVLKQKGVLWVTPQGQFVDARIRPLVFKPGLAALAARASISEGTCTVLPLAVEYSFWDERLPEVLLRFGKPVQVAPGDTPASVHARLISALDITMDELREMAYTRDAQAFKTILKGELGVGGFYALIERLQAIVTRRPLQTEHTVARNHVVERGETDA